MNYLSLEEVIILHNDIMEAMNGLKGYNKTQIGYLESALSHIQNDELYPSFLDKLTHLIFSCVKFHPFLDGNKRTALYLAKAFIKLNYPKLVREDFYERLEDVVVEVASDSINKDGLREILKEMLDIE
ncbi:type II toxin-antitoxin system death-on-curing family toxin [uncultured Helicobacter sp.]|uniref:type II toxin-antitoxin system death-on-curing family toxin n=1 Tax=uncultured Helicobacter sp. TaxID=175537 RepID=UPI001C39AA95|nr:type II toxin-antitoxin system death-on-curing family toxin [Candidatus Helicobacter avicola]